MVILCFISENFLKDRMYYVFLLESRKKESLGVPERGPSRSPVAGVPAIKFEVGC